MVIWKFRKAKSDVGEMLGKQVGSWEGIPGVSVAVSPAEGSALGRTRRGWEGSALCTLGTYDGCDEGGKLGSPAVDGANETDGDTLGA